MATMFLLWEHCDVTISMTNVDPGLYDPILLLLDGPEPENCIAYADANGPGLGETLTVPGLTPGYYYAVVDSYEECGYWDLWLYLDNCVSPTPTSPPVIPATGSSGLAILLAILSLVLIKEIFKVSNKA